MVQDFLKFNNMISNAFMLVLNRFLAVIMYWTNLVLLVVLAANNIVKVDSYATFWGSHIFPCQSLLSSASVLDHNNQ